MPSMSISPSPSVSKACSTEPPSALRLPSPSMALNWIWIGFFLVSFTTAAARWLLGDDAIFQANKVRRAGILDAVGHDADAPPRVGMAATLREGAGEGKPHVGIARTEPEGPIVLVDGFVQRPGRVVDRGGDAARPEPLAALAHLPAVVGGAAVVDVQACHSSAPKFAAQTRAAGSSTTSSGSITG